MIQSATCILTAAVHCEAFFLCQSHNMPLLFQHQGESSLSFPRNCSLLPTLQWRHKTFSCVIVSQSPKYCSVLSPRQINHEKTASVCFLIASSCPHKHSQTFWTASEKGTESTLCIKLKCSNWNIVGISTRLCVPSLAYRSDVASEEKYSGSIPERVRLQESSNAVILLCASLACCTFQLNQCTFRFDHGKGCNSVCRFQVT